MVLCISSLGWTQVGGSAGLSWDRSVHVAAVDLAGRLGLDSLKIVSLARL